MLALQVVAFLTMPQPFLVFFLKKLALFTVIFSHAVISVRSSAFIVCFCYLLPICSCVNVLLNLCHLLPITSSVTIVLNTNLLDCYAYSLVKVGAFWLVLYVLRRHLKKLFNLRLCLQSKSNFAIPETVHPALQREPEKVISQLSFLAYFSVLKDDNIHRQNMALF